MKRCDSPFRVVVAEANPIIVQGLTAIVEARDGYRVIASTCDGGQCLELITSLKPEISIIGTSLPNFSGWQIAAAAVAGEARRGYRGLMFEDLDGLRLIFTG